MLVCPTLLLWVAVLNNNMVKIKYARPKILAGHLVGSRRPKMARGPQFGNLRLYKQHCNVAVSTLLSAATLMSGTDYQLTS